MAKVISIEAKTETRPIDLEEFIAMKGIEPYNTFRFMSKKINFGFLFGMVGKTFSDRELSKQWTEEQVDNYIEENGIIDTIKNIKKKYKFEMSDLDLKYIAVSEDIRKKFFDTYSGLEKRIKDLREYFSKKGYVRSYYGAFRKNMLVTLDGNEEDRKERAGLDNIAVNSTIQAFEAAIVMRNMTIMSRWLRENKMQSRIIGTCHDSVDFYIEISEIPIVVPKIREVFEKMYNEFKEVPLTIEIKIGNNYKEGDIV